ncbi:MAG: phosphatidylserine decarboxylase [Rickettsiales bacterium]|nr:phosphatidylserine decarboxylase [Rickettsiales bacterium]
MSSIKSTFNRIIVPINPEGYNIIVFVAVLAGACSLISSTLSAIMFVVLSLCVYFFRDPERVINDDKDVLVAPADGVIDAIEQVCPPEELEMDENEEWTRVSIFLSVFNVHIQRMPYDGKITKIHYREGKFLNVSVDKYSKDNERQSCVLETENGLQIPVVQIAGLIARRIVCNLNVGQEIKKGDKYGIIKFGSRVDIYLPKGIVPAVKIGQTMIAGESIIAKIK